MEAKTPLNDEDRNTDQIMRGMRMLAYLALTLAFAAYVIWFHITNGQTLSSDAGDWGSFGDFFGGTVGPFIGFASIVLLVETLKLQQRGLREQREQLQRSADEVRQQNRILAIQSFEQSFFSWMKDYKEQIDELSIENEPDLQHSDPGGVLRGRHALRQMIFWCCNPFDMASRLYETSAKRLLARSQDISAEDLELALKKVSEQWVNSMHYHADWLGSMLRTLYGLFRWIDEHSQLTAEEKQHYASIVRARLSNAELRMLFINGMSPNGHKFAKYINKYSLFDNLPDPDLPVLDALKRHPECPYTQAAYKTSATQEDD